MKKLFVSLFAMLLAVSALFAGGSAEEANDEGQTVLRFAVFDIAQDASTKAVKEAFEAENPDIKIEFIDIPSAEYTKKLNVMLNGGSDLDLFLSHEPDKTKALYNKGQVANLSSFVEASGIDLSAYNGAESNFVYDGGLYGMPIRLDKYVLYYNKDMFDAAGLPYPDNDMTWKEFEETAAKLTTGTGAAKKYGAHFHTWQACVQNWAYQSGEHNIMDGNYEIFKPYYEMVLRMQKAGSIMDYATIKSSGISYNIFLQGKIGMLPMGTWTISGYLAKQKLGEMDCRWGIAVLPHAEDVPAGYTIGSITPICMNNASKKKDAAWRFIQFISGEKGQRIYAQNGYFPALMNPEFLDIIANIPGMPENAMEGLYTAHIVPDRPAIDKVTAVDQMLGEEHSLIMLEELSIDEGIAEMEARFHEIVD